ncbi:hypothetical protein D3C83_109530 [compost metagenome]
MVATRPTCFVSCTIFRNRRTAYAIRTPGVFISEWMLPVALSTLNFLPSCEYGRPGMKRTLVIVP